MKDTPIADTNAIAKIFIIAATVVETTVAVVIVGHAMRVMNVSMLKGMSHG